MIIIIIIIIIKIIIIILIIIIIMKLLKSAADVFTQMNFQNTFLIPKFVIDTIN